MVERSERRGIERLWRREGDVPRWGALVVVIIILIATLGFLVGSFRGIPAGYKGVVINGPSGPERNEINEGWHFNPSFMLSQIEVIRYNLQTRDMIGADGLSLTVRSAD